MASCSSSSSRRFSLSLSHRVNLNKWSCRPAARPPACDSAVDYLIICAGKLMDVPQPAVHNTHKSKWEGEQERAQPTALIYLCGDALARSLTFCLRDELQRGVGGRGVVGRQFVPGILPCSVMRLIGNGAALPAALFYRRNKMQVQLLENTIEWIAHWFCFLSISSNVFHVGCFSIKTNYG